MFATTVQAELNATLHVCESDLQDVLTNRSNFTSNVVFQFLYGAWRLKRKSLCQQATQGYMYREIQHRTESLRLCSAFLLCS
jgi:hypothetical protein